MNAESSLDVVLTEVGEFGLYQIVTYFLICIPSILSATYVVNYMVSANTLEYRCKVPECDIGENNRDITYDQAWVRSAIPTLSDGKLKNCVRYAPVSDGTGIFSNKCSADMFNTSVEIECTEFIYSSDERNIQTELNIHCSDSYKLALVGTASNLGRFIFLPVIGLLSDKYGRLAVVIIGMVCGSLFGIIKSFATSYLVYITLEFLEALGTTTFSGIFLLAVEWVNTKYRIFGSVLVSLSFPLGEMLLGFVALYVHDYRHIIRLLYTPGLLIVAYYWILPESVRWLLINGQVERGIKILKRIAHVNGKELSEKSIDMIKSTYSTEIKLEPTENGKIDNNSLGQSLKLIIKSRKLCLRFLNCSFQWINCCFCYYGISLIATQIPGENRYIGFIFVVGIEIPGLLIAIPLLNRMKRRLLVFAGLIVTAVSVFATACIPAEHSTAILLFFMLGKCSITLVFNSVYIYTAEQWPTCVRTTLINSCSMIGRIGSMIAPVIVIVVAQYCPSALLFGTSAILAAILIIFCPETYSKKLPDTVDEAKALRVLYSYRYFKCKASFFTEQSPTCVRTTLINSRSMIGRIASMITPVIVVVVAQYCPSALLFGTSAILAAILIIFCPETYSKKLPDTVDGAKALN
ncbi:solute carrier family 22 member 6-A-like [Contarinia nasturtii]|uniref:solute carrier family 22 member 6-A-like n=1 Tax=Contarinia nasturtii TaxID=265458 RepID=UPI0012D40514|nr:solute carrier family 22 member 6-A-like [Contarinia nasturtii]